MERRQVKLPRSAESRQSLAFAILIQRVLPQRSMGDAFQGKRLRPGATIAESDLWPTPEWPEHPLLLEYAGSDRAGSGHRRSSQTYLLWRYDPELPGWREIARASAVGIEWVDTLKPVAARYLAASEPPSTGADATARVLCVLESELEPLQSNDRRNLLGMLWEQVLGRMGRDHV
jgi:hypothetical protein